MAKGDIPSTQPGGTPMWENVANQQFRQQMMPNFLLPSMMPSQGLMQNRGFMNQFTPNQNPMAAFNRGGMMGSGMMFPNPGAIGAAMQQFQPAMQRQQTPFQLPQQQEVFNPVSSQQQAPQLQLNNSMVPQQMPQIQNQIQQMQQAPSFKFNPMMFAMGSSRGML